MTFGTPFDMPRVWVNFLGVCTHFPNPPVADPPGWRVVLPNASPRVIADHSFLKNRKVAPHVARLELMKEQVVSIKGDAPFDDHMPDHYMLDLKGVKLEIVNGAVAGPLQDYTSCSPRLLKWVGIRPSTAVTDADPASAACYFDLSAGHLRGTLVHQACVLLFTTATLGNPQLLITPFQGGSSTLVTLRNPKVDPGSGLGLPVRINVMNHPVDTNDRNLNHFLLHYLTTNGFPSVAVTPVVRGCEVNPSSPSELRQMAESAGCSNATYK